MTSKMVGRFVELLMARRDEARTRGVARRRLIEREGRELDDVVLSGPSAAASFTLWADSPGGRIFWYTELGGQIIDFSLDGLVDVDSRRPLTSEAVSEFLSQLEMMYIVPPIEVPYGIVSDGTVVGIVFTTGITSEYNQGRSEIGILQDLYVLDPDRFPIDLKTIVDEASWLVHFWNLRREGTIVCLSNRLEHSYGVSDSETIWIEVEKADNRVPQIVVGVRYRSWNFESQAFYVGSEEPLQFSLRSMFK